MLKNYKAGPTPAYETIGPLMKRWRSNGCPYGVPQSYITYHENLARQALEDLKRDGCKVHSTTMERDGWMMDDMKVLVAVVEEPNGRLCKLVWHDSHDDGYFMEKQPNHGGSTIYSLEVA
jgi:hypothetical protein